MMRPGFAHVPRPHRRTLSARELETYVNELAGRPELWIDFVKHDRSQRVYEELFSDDYLTAWLICWMNDHDTGFHDHDISSGAVAVVSGRVREERLMLDGDRASGAFKAGESFHFSPTDIHRVRHDGGALAFESVRWQSDRAHEVGLRAEIFADGGVLFVERVMRRDQSEDAAGLQSVDRLRKKEIVQR